jgi:hypothetical protein
MAAALIKDPPMAFSPSEVMVLEKYFKKEHVFMCVDNRTTAAAKVIVVSNTEKFGLTLKNKTQVLGSLEGSPQEKWIFIDFLENKTIKTGKAKIPGKVKIQGVGTFLLERSFFEAVKKELEGMLALDFTEASRKFYDKLGFDHIKGKLMVTSANLRRTWKVRLLCKAHMSDAATPLPFHLLDLVSQYWTR